MSEFVFVIHSSLCSSKHVRCQLMVGHSDRTSQLKRSVADPNLFVRALLVIDLTISN